MMQLSPVQTRTKHFPLIEFMIIIVLLSLLTCCVVDHATQKGNCGVVASVAGALAKPTSHATQIE